MTSIKINFAYFQFVTAQLFICTSMPLQHTFGVPFCHRLCTCVTRQQGLLDRLYSVASQPQVHHPRSEADLDFTPSLRPLIKINLSQFLSSLIIHNLLGDFVMDDTIYNKIILTNNVIICKSLVSNAAELPRKSSSASPNT